MTVTDVAARSGTSASTIRARKAGFVRDVISVAGRALRSLPREPEALVPALIVPLFFFVVNIGSLQELSEAAIPGLDSRRSSCRWRSSSPSPACRGRTPWSPTSRTATSTGCCSPRSAGRRCCSG